MLDKPRVSDADVEGLVRALPFDWPTIHEVAKDLQDALEELKALLDSMDDVGGLQNMETRLRKKYGWDDE